MLDLLKVDMHLHVYPTYDIGMAEKAYEVWEYGSLDTVEYSSCAGTSEELTAILANGSFNKSVLLIYFKGKDKLQKLIKQSMSEGKPASDDDVARFKLAIEKELGDLNRWGCEVSKRDPRINTFVTVDIAIQTPESAAAMVADLARDSARGLKIHCALQGFSMSDRRLWPVYEVCEQMGLPVLGHAGPDRAGLGLSDPNAFSGMLEAFPDLNVVIAHMGGAAWRQTLDVATKYGNAFFDCSEIIHWTGAPNAPSVDELAKLIKDVGTNRVMLGSDFPWYDFDSSLQRLFALPLLSEDDKYAIAGANAVRILGL